VPVGDKVEPGPAEGTREEPVRLFQRHRRPALGTTLFDLPVRFVHLMGGPCGNIFKNAECSSLETSIHRQHLVLKQGCS
jgi:hypothetical protein